MFMVFITTGEVAFISNERYIEMVSNVFDKKTLNVLMKLTKIEKIYLASDSKSQSLY